jgi:hypothetical protein
VSGPDELHEYLFDLKLFASVRVKAESEAAARALIAAHIHCADVNFGAWPDGSPILGEASVDGEADLMEIDGEAPDAEDEA